MNKSLHPAALAAAVAVLVATVALLFVKFGSPEVHPTSIADSMKIEVNNNKVNGITGEPLLPDQLEAQRRQNEMVRKIQGTSADPRVSGSGTAPHLEPDAH